MKIFQKTRTSNIDDDDDAKISKFFRKNKRETSSINETTTSSCDVNNCNNITLKVFDKTTIFDDDFDEMTTTKRCSNILTKNKFNRFDNVMIYLITFSYFCTKLTTLSSFDKFFQISYSKSYFFHLIKYFDFFFYLTFVDKTFYLEKFNVDNVFFDEHEIRLIKFEFAKKIVKKNEIWFQLRDIKNEIYTSIIRNN